MSSQSQNKKGNQSSSKPPGLLRDLVDELKLDNLYLRDSEFSRQPQVDLSNPHSYLGPDALRIKLFIMCYPNQLEEESKAPAGSLTHWVRTSLKSTRGYGGCYFTLDGEQWSLHGYRHTMRPDAWEIEVELIRYDQLDYEEVKAVPKKKHPMRRKDAFWS